MRLVQINTTIFVNPDYVLAVYWGTQAPVVEVALPGGGRHNYEAYKPTEDLDDDDKAAFLMTLCDELVGRA